ncbi:MAG: hypothetical protein KPI85_01980 [cyanobacterium endosymbiont of Epithemia adnata isolate EadnSB Bon19]|jgi:hypothetical protein|uniref:CCE_0567 family metalloprotein n=1 Tax=cyanobacterium endosymbiont of Epithemia turgida TaxID=718217 RepID=UPI0004D1F180|nr:CCE_0567 family metalloprotein [cyanobacterium endosymbiont of Epithemia turgida]BAP18204.1 hypothetical protein ETSB_1464 [cyanobacterium endosymbiont of Epithemia turgida isolate EtSB Lake Yunoko]
MEETTTTKPTLEDIEALKKSIKRLNSKSGQQKMDLHDLAEGLPINYKTLLEMAQKTYDIYFELDQLKKQLKSWEEL